MSKLTKEEFLKFKGQTIKVQFVEDNEDIKARFVCCTPEDVTYEEVSDKNFNGKTIRVKLVSFDEDIKIKLRTNNGEIKFIIG
jgi:ribosome maturation factor RimP